MSIRYTDFWEQMASASAMRSGGRIEQRGESIVLPSPRRHVLLTSASVIMDDEQGISLEQPLEIVKGQR
jgi:hypothetical protein